MDKSYIKAHLSLLAANIIYGINYSVAKDVMPSYIGPSGFVFLRVSGALILFWIFSFFLKKEKIESKDIIRLMLCGFFGVALNQLLFFEGLSLTTPINAGIIMVTTPILVLIISSILIREKVTGTKVIGILTGITGAMILILFNSQLSVHHGDSLGDLFIFLNATSYAVYLAMVKPLMKKYQTFTVIKWIFLWGFIFVFPFGWNGFSLVEWAIIPITIWYKIAFVVLGTTFLAYLLNTYALKVVTPTVASIYIYLQPLFAAFIALMLGKDEITLLKIVSTILIFTGVYLVSKQTKNKEEFIPSKI
ncbi:MAG: DMT family transporter [Bacteroidetes bacterium]|nr:DMT family transporter [Bacteroidota bacterium]HET6245436.1 DMT family transporter [Bacteroidia bacterium]